MLGWPGQVFGLRQIFLLRAYFGLRQVFGLRRIWSPQGLPRLIAVLLILGFWSLLAACSEPPPTREAEHRDRETGRWYTSAQVSAGAPIFAQYCAACHGTAAEGAPEWFRRLPDGRWPAPPLNGTGHAWHHPLWQLRQQIQQGSQPENGDMPPFANILSQAEIDAVIAWFQHFWPDPVYAAWLEYDAHFPQEHDSHH